MKLLIIDDDKNYRKYLKNIFNWVEYGYTTVAESENGEDGLRDIFMIQPDLVLLEIKITKLNGLDLIQKAKNGNFTGKIIIISRHSRFDYAQRAIRYGVEAYFKKPINKIELAETIQRIYQHNGDKSILIYDLLSGKIDLTKTELLSDIYQVVIIHFNKLENKENFINTLNDKDKNDNIIMNGDKIVCLLTGKAQMLHFKKYIGEATAAIFSRVTDTISDLPLLYQETEYISNKFFYYATEGKFINCSIIHTKKAFRTPLKKYFILTHCETALFPVKMNPCLNVLMKLNCFIATVIIQFKKLPVI